MAYLNHAGTSWPKPEPVRRAVAAALEAGPGDWGAAYDRGHGALARALDLPRPERLLLTPGGTSALALALADVPWAAGDVVLTSRCEHHAVVRPLRQLEARGVTVERVGRAGGGAGAAGGAAGGPLDLDALERRLAAGGVRLLALTTACNVTGELLPVEAAARLAREHGALVLLDASQTVGWFDHAPLARAADLLAFAGHKGLQAPWGLGGLVVAPEVSLAPPGAACSLEPPADGAAPACGAMPSFCDAGSVDRLALAGLEAALPWLDDPARADRLAAGRAAAARLAEGARALGYRLHGDPDPDARLPTVALTWGDDPAAQGEGTPTHVARRLEGLGVTASAGHQCAPEAHEALGTAAHGVLRLSLGATSGPDDVDRALEALARARPGAAARGGAPAAHPTGNRTG